MNQRQTQADRDGCESRRRALIGCAQNDHQEHEGQHNLRYQARDHRIPAGRVRFETIGCESAAEAESRLATRDHEKHAGARDAAEHLRNYIGHQIRRRKSLAYHEPQRHRGIQVTTGNMTDGEGHGHDR